MTDQDLGNADADKSAIPASTAATEQSEKVETQAKEQTSEATPEEGKQPDTGKPDPAKEAEAASEAAKALQKRKQTMQERLNDVTHARREAERRAERAERDLAQLRKTMKAPVADEYTDPAKLTADQVNHTLDQRKVQELENERTEAANEAEKARAVAFWERHADYKAENPDFDLANVKGLGTETQMMIADMEDAFPVLDHLGKNPAEARRIEGLPEKQRPFALGKLAAQITAPPIRRVTSAPGPVEQTSGKSGGGTGFDPAKASPAEFSARYRKMRERD